MYDPELGQLITSAFGRLDAALSAHAPFIAEQVSSWAKGLSGADLTQEEYFTHPCAFPMLLLPWWLEKTQSPNPDLAFQGDLVYSTISYYYHIRLTDNLMDGHATLELSILPVLACLFAQFQRRYQHYFAPEHPFWESFDRFLIESCEATIRDASLDEISCDQFVRVSAKKTGAVKIPLAAVCYRYERPELLPSWEQFVDLFGCWHQMYNDLYDWHRDLQHNTPTYFLFEANRRKTAGESVAGWVIREGFAWGNYVLQTCMSELKAAAVALDSPDLGTYLNSRERMMAEQGEEVMRGLESLVGLLAVSA
jgi:hypothetical protein